MRTMCSKNEYLLTIWHLTIWWMEHVSFWNQSLGIIKINDKWDVLFGTTVLKIYFEIKMCFSNGNVIIKLIFINWNVPLLMTIQSLLNFAETCRNASDFLWHAKNEIVKLVTKNVYELTQNFWYNRYFFNCFIMFQ